MTKFHLRDKTPNGYGPVSEPQETDETKRSPAFDEAEAQKLRSVILDGRTLLRGKPTPQRRRQIEESVVGAIQALEQMGELYDHKLRGFERVGKEANGKPLYERDYNQPYRELQGHDRRGNPVYEKPARKESPNGSK